MEQWAFYRAEEAQRAFKATYTANFPFALSYRTQSNRLINYLNLWGRWSFGNRRR